MLIVASILLLVVGFILLFCGAIEEESGVLGVGLLMQLIGGGVLLCEDKEPEYDLNAPIAFTEAQKKEFAKKRDAIEAEKARKAEEKKEEKIRLKIDQQKKDDFEEKYGILRQNIEAFDAEIESFDKEEELWK